MVFIDSFTSGAESYCHGIVILFLYQRGHNSTKW